MSKKCIGLIFGGPSAEHDISLRSANSIVKNWDYETYNLLGIYIDKNFTWYVQEIPNENHNITKELFSQKVELTINNGELALQSSRGFTSPDAFFPMIHGAFGEDGQLQSLLETANVPFVGCSSKASHICMDKEICKSLLENMQIPTTPYLCVRSVDELSDAYIQKKLLEIGMSYFVKPASGGSSVGVSKAETQESLVTAVNEALKYDNKVLIEKSIKAREIECAILGNSNPKITDFAEIIPTTHFYSFESKYIDENGAKFQLPAAITSEQKEQLAGLALKSYKGLALSGMARIDFFIDKDSSDIYLNEINTIPGFTNISQYPQLWMHQGMSYKQLLNKLIELALNKNS